MLSILDLLFDLPSLLFDLGSSSGVSCPRCGHRLKYVTRVEHEDKVQCVMCERVWLRSKAGWLGHSLRSDESAFSEVNKP